MRPALMWCAVALVAMAGNAPLARAQGDDMGEPAIENLLPGDEGDLAQAMDELDVPGPQAMAPGEGDGMAPGRWGMMGRGAMMGRGLGAWMGRARALDLSDAQREKIADIREAHMKAAITGRANTELAELELRKLLRAPKPDVGAVLRQIDKIAALRATLAKNRVTGMLEARAVLTPEQIEKLRAPGRMGPGREGMRDGPRRGGSQDKGGAGE